MPFETRMKATFRIFTSSMCRTHTIGFIWLHENKQKSKQERVEVYRENAVMMGMLKILFCFLYNFLKMKSVIVIA